MPDRVVADPREARENGRAGPIADGPGPEVIADRPRPAVGAPVPHESARAHVSGEAVYIDDIPPSRGELFVDFVGSAMARGRITSIDVAGAARMEGVAAVLTAGDIPGSRTFGPVF